MTKIPAEPKPPRLPETAEEKAFYDVYEKVRDAVTAAHNHDHPRAVMEACLSEAAYAAILGMGLTPGEFAEYALKQHALVKKLEKQLRKLDRVRRRNAKT